MSDNDDTVEVIITDRDGELRGTKRVSRQRFQNEYAHNPYVAARSVDDVKQAYVDGEINEAEFERRIEAALQHDGEQVESKLLDEKEAGTPVEKLFTGFVIGVVGVTALSIAAAFYLAGAYVGLAIFGSLLMLVLTAWIWGFI